jgi:uncharacterized protein (DUF488 family)
MGLIIRLSSIDGADTQDKEVKEMAKHQLFTTGYAGRSPELFLETLRGNSIDVVVDIRQNPVSRKKGFSRNGLSDYLRRNGIEYRHVRELGVPSHLRNSLRNGDFALADYFSEFREYLQGQAAALDQLYASAKKERCCLLCVEERSEECHRSIVASEVAARNGRTVEIVHV